MKKILIANRGEIAKRIIRACHELGLKTVAIYAKEDNLSDHRFEADEAYQLKSSDKPVAAYLDIENIIKIAKIHGADAIHPGYGFLSENAQFAQRCKDEGIIFIGPKVNHLKMFGDKVAAKKVARKAGVQAIPGTDKPVGSVEKAIAFGNKYGFPIMIKAAMGGGGRGMRIVSKASNLKEAFNTAQSEAQKAFGSPEVYLEKLLSHPKHVEVQILGDYFGNIIHLFERDCSVQRRNQKIIEFAPAIAVPKKLREQICQSAVKIARSAHYVNAATIEFLVEDNKFYFLEVNPRLQVEHTVTELITGYDIVQTQIKIAQGLDLFKDIGFPSQKQITYHGCAIQCRITTEDPTNHFMPDTGTVMACHLPGGNGVRLDTGSLSVGSEVTPYFDSLLAKVIVKADNFKNTSRKMLRALNEFKIRGVKTNIPFLLNVISQSIFQQGRADTHFVEKHPELFNFPESAQKTSKLLQYIGDVTVNGFSGVPREKNKYYPKVGKPDHFSELPDKIFTAKDVLDKYGVNKLKTWLLNQKRVLLTDTTMRDAHQSLFATRMRTKDMLAVAKNSQKALPQLFSYEMWGGATFDVAYRFLNEDPWERLKKLRKAMPRTLFQMLFRGSNAVGYKNYSDNVIEEFIKESAKNGIDVFRIFDSLNWLPQMEKSIQAVKDTGKIAEGTICYTGDILNPNQHKYTLEYFKQLALDLQSIGADIIAIKDMAGVLKPEGAYKLVSTLKNVLDIPVHLHMHDTTGNGIATYVQAVKAGVDVVDVAANSFSGTTSQPALGSLYYALSNSSRQPAINISNAEKINDYWQSIRPYYQDFSNGVVGSLTTVYQAQMPGGQYSNLQQQAKSSGLGDKWNQIQDMYIKVNQMFGDIIKVTPSSKVVGDMTLFMIQNDLMPKDIYQRGDEIDFPESVINFFAGNIGQPAGGFPKKLQKIILKDKKPLTVRPGQLAKPIDFNKLKEKLASLIGRQPTFKELLSYAIYPKVFLDYFNRYKKYGDVSILDTPTFFQGIRIGETVNISLDEGKNLVIKLEDIGNIDSNNNRVLYFNINGQDQKIIIQDSTVKQLSQAASSSKKKADPSDINQLGATINGSVVKVLVKEGQKVKKGDSLIVTEAMKMETTVQAPKGGIISKINVSEGEAIQNGDLMIELSDVKKGGKE